MITRLSKMALSMMLLFSLAACGGAGIRDGGGADAVNPSQTSSPTASAIEVDKGLTTVTITLPASMFEEDGLLGGEDVNFDETRALEGVKSVTQNPDGSVTMVMSKSAHRKMLADLKSSVDESIAELVNDTSNSISSVTYNEEMSELNFYVDRAAFEASFDAIIVAFFPVLPAIYQAYAGVSEIQVTVNVIDAQTNEVFKTTTFPEE